MGLASPNIGCECDSTTSYYKSTLEDCIDCDISC